MHPILWQSGTFFLPSWHALFLLACLASFLLFRKLTKLYSIQLLPFVSSAYIWAYLGALLGGRALSVLIEEEHFDLAKVWTLDSLTLYGGFLGAIVLTSLYLKIKNLPLGPFWDLMIPSFLLGLAIGRIGCFLNGDDYGIPLNADAVGHFPWWSVVFPNHPEPIPRFPVQLVESALSLFFAALLVFFFSKIQAKRIGLVGSLGVLAYAIERFFIEYYRDDFRGWILADKISTSQGISLVLICGILIHYAFTEMKKTAAL